MSPPSLAMILPSQKHQHPTTMDRSIALRIFAIAVLCCTSIQASGLDFEESDMQIEAKSHSSSSVFVPADGVHRRVKRSGDGVVDTTKDGATFDERLLTIRWHNDYRSDVSPTATNMQHMVGYAKTHTVLQRQKAVAAYLKSKKLLPFIFTRPRNVSATF